MSDVKLDVDISAGKLCVVCSEAALGDVLEKLEQFLPTLISHRDALVEDLHEDAEAAKAIPPGEANATADVKATGESKARRSASRRPTYSIIDLGLDKEKERELKQFYDLKGPKNQNDQLLVIMYWLQQNGNRPVFEVNCIFTGLRKVGAKVPARIESVLGNLMLEGKVTNPERGKYTLSHIGEDRADKELPAKAAQ